MSLLGFTGGKRYPRLTQPMADLTKLLRDSRFSMKNEKFTPLKFNSSTLKNDGFEDSCPFKNGNSSGRAAKLRGCKLLFHGPLG